MSLKVAEKGPKVEAIQHAHAPQIPRVPGRHLWIMVGMYRVRPGPDWAKQRVHLDTENLVTIEGPGCYWCEETWRPGLENTKCPGGSGR